MNTLNVIYTIMCRMSLYMWESIMFLQDRNEGDQQISCSIRLIILSLSQSITPSALVTHSPQEERVNRQVCSSGTFRYVTHLNPNNANITSLIPRQKLISSPNDGNWIQYKSAKDSKTVRSEALFVWTSYILNFPCSWQTSILI